MKIKPVQRSCAEWFLLYDRLHATGARKIAKIILADLRLWKDEDPTEHFTEALIAYGMVAIARYVDDLDEEERP